jgi:hypothetical protein
VHSVRTPFRRGGGRCGGVAARGRPSARPARSR